MHVARLLAELRPRWFLGENVPGLLSVNDGRDFATVVDDLAGLGYGFCWRVLDAQHFGVPQRRRRVFIVGHLGDRAAPVQVLLEPEGRSGNSAPRRAAGADIAGTLTSRINGSRSTDLDGHGAYVPFAVHENQRGEITTSDTAGALKTGGGKPGQGYPAVAYALRADPGGTGQGHNTNFIGFHLTQDPISGDVVPAMGAESTGNGVTDGTAVRRLTPLECERLQGFPDGWTATSNGKPQSDSARYRQLGNAVAVPVVEWIARRITAVDGAA